MIVGLQKAAEEMTRKGRPTTYRGLQGLLSSGRHPGFGRRDGTIIHAPYVFTDEELDRLIERVRPYRRKVAS